MRRALVVAAISTFATRASAETYTSLDDVRACVVQPGGSVLVATTGGVARIAESGAIERVWTSLDGLPDTKAHALLESGGEIVVGTDADIARLQGNAITRAVKTAPARALATLGNDLYVGTWGDGLLRIGEGAETKVPFAAAGLDGRKRVASLATFEGTLVAGTMGGVVRLVDGKLVGAPSLLAQTWSLGSSGNRLYVGTAEGLVSLGSFESGAVTRHESDADVRALARWSNELMGASFGNGLLAIGKNVTPAPSAPSAKYVQALGSFGSTRCIGTPSGLFVSHDGKPFVAQPTSNLPSNDIAALARDGDKLWIGTFDKGLALLEGGKLTKVPSSVVDDKVNAIAIDHGRTWVATARGLALLDGNKQKRFGEDDGLPSMDVHTVVALAKGGVIAGTSKGAVRIEGGTVTPIGKKQGAPSEAVWAIAELSDGTLLLGTNAGLYRGRPGAAWTRLSVVTGHLKDDWVTALAVNGNDVWVGTYAGGVTRLDDKDFTPQHLGGGYVNPAGILVEGDAIWVATMDGLLTRKKSATTWTKPPKSALGLDVTAIVKATTGYWVASRRGLLHW